MPVHLSQLVLVLPVITLGLPVESEKVKPNILFVLSDDLGWNDVGFHGSKQVHTPTLDRMANEGIILNNHYALALCTPSRTALMTGRHPVTIGLQYYVIQAAQRLGIPLNYKLLPEYLNDLGYESHMVGKWHLGNFQRNYTPTFRGFNSFFGYYLGFSDYFDHRTQAAALGMDPVWWGLDLHFNEGEILRDVYSAFGEYSTKLFANRASDIIAQHDFDAKPLFLYFALSNPHTGNNVDPVQAPWETQFLFQNVWHNVRRKYVANVYEMDVAVRNVVNSLQMRRVLNNTIVVFASDNGGVPNGYSNNWGNNFPLRAAKGYYFEGGVRAAAFVWGEMFKQRAGQVSNDLMFVSDWLPTLYEAAGGDVKNLGDIDGYSMLDVFLGNNKTCPRTEALLNIDPVYNLKAIRVGQYKYILNPFDLHDSSYDYWFQAPGDLPYSNETMRPNTTKSQIWCGEIPSNVDLTCMSKITGLQECVYDIENDPCEYYNLVDDPDYQEVKEMLLERLTYWEGKQVEPMIPPNDEKANPKLHNMAFGPWTNDPVIPPNPSSNSPESMNLIDLDGMGSM